jgi:hypothetical protein
MNFVEIIPIVVVVRHLDMVGRLGIVLNIIAVVMEIFGMLYCTILRNIFHCAEMSVIVSWLELMAAIVGWELSWGGTGPW